MLKNSIEHAEPLFIALLQVSNLCGHRKVPTGLKIYEGGFCLCPPEPKYFVTWDVNQVLNLLKSWSPANSIILKQLTLKLFMLAALISAARKSSLDKFDLRFRFFKSNGVLFKVPGLTKCAN